MLRKEAKSMGKHCAFRHKKDRGREGGGTGALVNDEVTLIAPSYHFGNVYDTLTMASTIQRAYIPIRGLPVYGDKRYDPWSVRRTFES